MELLQKYASGNLQCDDRAWAVNALVAVTRLEGDNKTLKLEKQNLEERCDHEKQKLEEEKQKLEQEKQKLEQEKQKLEERCDHEKQKLEEEKQKLEQAKQKLEERCDQEKKKLEQKLEDATAQQLKLHGECERFRGRIEGRESAQSNSRRRRKNRSSTPYCSSLSNAEVAENVFQEKAPVRLNDMLMELAPARADSTLATFCAYETLQPLAFGQAEREFQAAMRTELTAVNFKDPTRCVKDTSQGSPWKRKPDFTLFYGPANLTSALLFIELKPWQSEGGKIDSAHLGQVASYCTLLLSTCRWQHRCYGVALNGSSLVLLRCTREEEGYVHERSEDVTFLHSSAAGSGECTAGVDALWRLLHAPRAQLAPTLAVSLRLDSGYECTSVWEGGSSTVFKVEKDDDVFAVKVFARGNELGSRDDFERERSFIEAVTNAPDQCSYRRYLPKLRSEKPCLVEVELPNHGVDLGGKEKAQPSVLVLEYAGETGESYGAAAFAGAVRGLQRAHELGFVHRDVRPPNVLFCPEEQLPDLDYLNASYNYQAVVIDWAWAQRIGYADDHTHHEFCALDCHCPFDRSSEGQGYEPKDDLCSLVLVFTHVVLLGGRGDPPDKGDRAARKEAWELRMGPFGRRLYELADACDYDGLVEGLGG